MGHCSSLSVEDNCFIAANIEGSAYKWVKLFCEANITAVKQAYHEDWTLDRL